MIQIGGKKKNKGKKQKKQQVEGEDVFQFDIVIIQKFGMLQISPPTDALALDSKMAELDKKKQWYQDNGASKLEEQMEELKKIHEQEDLEEKKEAAEYSEDRQRGERGRGGRGR